MFTFIIPHIIISLWISEPFERIATITYLGLLVCKRGKDTAELDISDLLRQRAIEKTPDDKISIILGVFFDVYPQFVFSKKWYNKSMKIKKVKKLTIGQLQKKLWQECRRVADVLYPPINGISYCYTCNKPISGSNKQLGHFVPKSVCGALLKYDVYRNLRWQCYFCNINCGGQGAIFCRRMIEDNGQEYVDKIFSDKNNSLIKAYDHYVMLLDTYSKL